jgi:hypothetical protein
MKKLWGRLSLITITISLELIISSKPHLAQDSNAKYECVIDDEIPITRVTTERGIIELIKWQSNYFSNSNWTPEKRCQAVTERFQVHSNSGSLRYITYGESNDQKVICVADKINLPKQPYRCKQETITVDDRTYDSTLITLEPQDDPGKVLQELFNLTARINYGGITRSATNYPTFVDLDKVLREAPLIQEN